MSLEIQIQSLVFSLVYGMFFALIMNLNYKYIFNTKIYYKIIVNFMFVVIMVMLYFILLRKINNGIFHSYFILMIVLGVAIGNYKTRVLRKLFLKKDITKQNE